MDATSIRTWLKKFGTDVDSQPVGDAALRVELRRLREENKRLLMEREILKKALAILGQEYPNAIH